MDQDLYLGGDDGEDALIAFSRDLELLFAGDAIVCTKNLVRNLLPVQIRSLLRNTTNKSDERDMSTCCFSACSKYFALSRSPMNTKKRFAELHVFSINVSQNFLEELVFPTLELEGVHSIRTSFHPDVDQPQLLLSCKKAISSWESENTCLLIDLSTRTVENLGSCSHPRRCKSFVGYELEITKER